MNPLHRRGLLAAAAAALVVPAASSQVRLAAPAPVVITPPKPTLVEVQIQMAPAAAPVATPPAAAPVPAAPNLPRWQRYAVARPADISRPAITIVIDDLGVMHAGTERVVAMPGPLTLSWFPFAKNLPDQVAAAALRGHEMTLHMPMQSFGNTIAWTGPDPLRIDLPEAVNVARLRAAIEAVPNTVGLNNHMGSVATRDPALMAIVAREAKAHDMLFLDSVVIAHSFGYSEAHDIGVPAASRDIFIDHTNNPKDIAYELDQIEQQARKHGHVIAIGHPWPHTIEALEAWLPTLQAKGFSLWPLSQMVARRNDLTMPA